MPSNEFYSFTNKGQPVPRVPKTSFQSVVPSSSYAQLPGNTTAQNHIKSLEGMLTKPAQSFSNLFASVLESLRLQVLFY
jgi:hypothetical protein